MKKLRLLLLFVIILTSTLGLSGCSGMREKFLKTDDSKIANKCFEKLIKNIQNQDADAIRLQFSNNVLKETQNMDENICLLFDYFKGEMLSYNDWGATETEIGVNDDSKHRNWKKLRSTYDIETTEDKYRVAMEFISKDTADEYNVGIRSLYIIRFEDDTDPQYAYRGDGMDTPGINIGEKNIIPD